MMNFHNPSVRFLKLGASLYAPLIKGTQLGTFYAKYGALLKGGNTMRYKLQISWTTKIVKVFGRRRKQLKTNPSAAARIG
jgi:hypothetical protein